jgi:hypothetical protein
MGGLGCWLTLWNQAASNLIKNLQRRHLNEKIRFMKAARLPSERSQTLAPKAVPSAPAPSVAHHLGANP